MVLSQLRNYGSELMDCSETQEFGPVNPNPPLQAGVVRHLSDNGIRLEDYTIA